MRALVTASLKPAERSGEVCKGEAGDSNSHCHVVKFRGTARVSFASIGRRGAHD
jgi:hypothetical protein